MMHKKTIQREEIAMELRSRLVPFEELIPLLKRYGLTERLDEIMKLKVFSAGASRNHPEPLLSEECREKYSGTWWEIIWPLPRNSTSPLCCFYVADSLRDALRLRPQADLSFCTENFTQYLTQTQDWLEEMEEASMLD
jgi:hypothetical protein